ncbi:sentrin-specific protease 1 isoform X1 [Huso huso]|uniref:Sentrin-specific protease 1 isoform X1 n=1 Tax=Huso huso TaxID=61971 RepID=A0ABR0YFJ7_HUSHU
MFNKLYEWLGIAGTPRNGAGDGAATPSPHARCSARKRPWSRVGEAADAEPEDREVKKFRMGELLGSVKDAADGMRSQGSNAVSWVRNNLSPALSSVLLRASQGTHSDRARPLPPTPTRTRTRYLPEQSEFLRRTPGLISETFPPPPGNCDWKASSKTEFSHGSGDCEGRSVPAAPVFESCKSNGHSHSAGRAPLPRAAARPAQPLLGRSLRLGARRTHGSSGVSGVPCSPQPCSSMYDESFPVRVLASPSRSSSSLHSSPQSTRRGARRQGRGAAEESVRREEKEVYRQLLEMVSGSKPRGSPSYTGRHSHRDLSSFLSSRSCLIRTAPPSWLEEEDGEERLGGTCSDSPIPSSQVSSALPSPLAGSSPLSNHGFEGDAVSLSVPSLLIQDDTQSSAPDSDSVIFVKEQHAKETEPTSAPYFHAELWIKELTSLYDSRARGRRRLIEEQEGITLQLQKQRLVEEGRQSQGSVELRLRVPLEKEVPVVTVIKELKPEPIREEEFPPLTQAMEEEVRSALQGGHQDEVLSEGFRLTITRKDLQTLSHLNWLNDEVINFYMNLLAERSKRPGLPRVHAFNTFFYPKVRSAGFNAVRRWTKKVDVFSMDILLVPVHLGVHWCLAVVDLRKKSICYFDSMGGTNDEACRILLQYLKQESQDKRNTSLDLGGWQLQCRRRNEIPQQMNGSDCGMFTCKYADYITKDKPITFTQKHMPYFRRRMVWEILNKKLL